jgi:gamma-glutamyltranspeptidase / glutathione hydrolase
VVMNEGEVELVLGSAGSNRIRSALLQTILGVVDHGWSVSEAIDAPRVHFENEVVFAEPGIDLSALPPETRTVSFGERNLFFGGVQAALRRDGTLSGAGDPRRGGAAVKA